MVPEQYSNGGKNRLERITKADDAYLRGLRLKIKLLTTLPRQERTPYVSISGKVGRPLSDMSLNAVLRRMEVDAVPHGFRSTFRDWAGESTSYPREVCKHTLAHKLADGVEAACQRGDILQKLVSMMRDWAHHCTSEIENMLDPKTTISELDD